MFRGRFEHNINSQGRVSLPAKWRQVLEERFNKKLILVGGQDKEKIVAYPEPSYQNKEVKDLELPLDDEAVDDYLLDEYNDVAEAELDGQGRVLIPPAMRQSFGLEKGVVFLGVTDKIFIYSQEAYQAAVARARARRKEVKQHVSELKQGRKSE